MTYSKKPIEEVNTIKNIKEEEWFLKIYFWIFIKIYKKCVIIDTYTIKLIKYLEDIHLLF